MSKSFPKIVLLLILLSIPTTGFSQMFSVGGNGPTNSSPIAPYIRLGVTFVDFQYQGNPNALIQRVPLSFSGEVAHFAYEANGLTIGASFGNKLTGLNDRSYTGLYLNFENPFYFIRKRNFAAGIPIKLATKLTNVSSQNVRDGFSQTNVGVGAGVIVRAQAPENFGFSAQLTPGIGFSTSSGGFFGGNVISMTGKTRLNIYNVIFGKNLSLGYDYNFDSYDIDGEEFDYDFSGHTFTLGISF
ncbi:hypothetical protein [Gracilimonas sp.]|uniref:hypothetical protein n=1 Tax=Gracilimonas sp. TaxID=1974203 RepID=UPI002870C969|nr:hypothetical protein [Gracilimonas sp.]